VAIVDNRHYTMRPGRLFFFPPFTLHKVMTGFTLRPDLAALEIASRVKPVPAIDVLSASS
jgi:hypothetical protein